MSSSTLFSFNRYSPAVAHIKENIEYPIGAGVSGGRLAMKVPATIPHTQADEIRIIPLA